MPGITIITINLNNATGLQKTIQSVLNQTFIDYEYIVIDGGSNDASEEIIQNYKDQISYWVSEPDKGVYNAMNKGIKNAKGEYLLFLNSGDYLIDENILEKVVKELDRTEIVYGNILLKEVNGKSWTGVYPDKLSFDHFVTGSLPHPASFIKRKLFDTVGLFDESLKICSDWKFFLDAILGYQVSYKHIDTTISVFHLDGMSSIGNSSLVIEMEKEKTIRKQYPEQLDTYNVIKKNQQPAKQSLVSRIKNRFRPLGK